MAKLFNGLPSIFKRKSRSQGMVTEDVIKQDSRETQTKLRSLLDTSPIFRQETPVNIARKRIYKFSTDEDIASWEVLTDKDIGGSLFVNLDIVGYSVVIVQDCSWKDWILKTSDSSTFVSCSVTQLQQH
jgi:hypothetical protein